MILKVRKCNAFRLWFGVNPKTGERNIFLANKKGHFFEINFYFVESRFSFGIFTIVDYTFHGN